MNNTAYHYTMVSSLTGIIRDERILPTPPLERYGLSRDAVEANPGLFGFQEHRTNGRRRFSSRHIPDRIHPGWHHSASWYEGEKFAASFSRAGWCNSVFDYLPLGMRDTSCAYRLVIDISGLDIFPWTQFQSRTNTPGAFRRDFGDFAQRAGDDTADWLFVLGSVPIAGRLLGIEQFHHGSWISFDTAAERQALKELHETRSERRRVRSLFRSSFVRVSHASVPVSLFGMVFDEDGKWIADHLWIRQTWDHLKPGDPVEFFADVVPYPRQDQTEGYSLDKVNGLVKLDHGELVPRGTPRLFQVDKDDTYLR
jgi:hypothetical protein